MTDRDQVALYAAELAAFAGTDLEQVRSFERIAAAVASLTDTEWWPGGEVEVRRARTDAGSSTTRCAIAAGEVVGVTIRLAAPQMTIATAAHELAHVLATTHHGHDAVFRRAYLDVVFVMTNMDTTDRRSYLHRRQLAEAFAALNLDVAPRDWPPPPAATGSAFAL